jgi:hypothetical protein
MAWSRIALLAPAAALCAMSAAFCLSAGSGVLSATAYATVLVAPAVFAWIAVGAGPVPQRLGLSLLGAFVAVAVAALLVWVVFPSLDTGEGIPGPSLQAFVLLPSLALLAGGLFAAWKSAPPQKLLARGGAVHLHRTYPHLVALVALWVAAGFVGWLAEPIALRLADLFHNDAIAAIAVFAAPPVALGAWLGAVAAALLSSRLVRSHRPQAAS